MEDPPYDSLVIIIAFWVLVLVCIIVVVCRLRYMKNLHENVRSPTEQVEPRRIIQIYYIENADGSQDLSGQTGSILRKILPRLEDQHPPSYEEATVMPLSAINANGLGNSDGEQPSTSSRSNQLDPNIANNGRLGTENQNEPRNNVVIVVDRTLPNSQ